MKKKIKPRLPQEPEKIYPHYGSMMLTSQLACHMKTTRICSVAGCNYVSRAFIYEANHLISQQQSVSSSNCPIHQKPLLNIGMVMRVPGKGNKRTKFLNELRNAEIIKIRNTQK